MGMVGQGQNRWHVSWPSAKRPRGMIWFRGKELQGYVRNGMSRAVHVGKHRSFRKRSVASPAFSPPPLAFPGEQVCPAGLGEDQARTRPPRDPSVSHPRPWRGEGRIGGVDHGASLHCLLGFRESCPNTLPTP